jgi:hypothetical protein
MLSGDLVRPAAFSETAFKRTKFPDELGETCSID